MKGGLGLGRLLSDVLRRTEAEDEPEDRAEEGEANRETQSILFPIKTLVS
jgi:hypothetical protein